MVQTVMLILIFLLLAFNSLAFWGWWFEDHKQRQRDIEHLLRMMTAYRKARLTEDVTHLMNREILEAFR